jgi:phospholipid-transporting ATPase
MPDEYEEGIGLLNNDIQRPSAPFVPDYTFSSLHSTAQVYTTHRSESTEMLEQEILPIVHNQEGKEGIYTTEDMSNYRRSIMKEKNRPHRSFKETLSSIFKRRKTVADGTPRIIHINNTELNYQQKFMSNSVSTAKYNIMTFLPKFLYEEFSKSANVFFLFISGIQVRKTLKIHLWY